MKDTRNTHPPGHLGRVLDQHTTSVAPISIAHANGFSAHRVAIAAEHPIESPAVEFSRLQRILTGHLKPRFDAFECPVIGPLPLGSRADPGVICRGPGLAVIQRRPNAGQQGVLCPVAGGQIHLKQVLGLGHPAVHAQHIQAVDRFDRGEMLYAREPGRLSIHCDQQIGVLGLGHHCGDKGCLFRVNAGRCDRLDPELALAIKARGQRETAGLDRGNEDRGVPGTPFPQLISHHLRLGIGQPPKL